MDVHKLTCVFRNIFTNPLIVSKFSLWKCFNYNFKPNYFNTSKHSYSQLLKNLKQNAEEYLTFSDCFDSKTKEVIQHDMVVIKNFLSEVEENSILHEIEPYMKRLRYEFDHWDDAIHGYRETERLKWNEGNTEILNRVKNFAFPNGSQTLALVHVLDLAEDGHIKPHIDSVRFCGNVITGLSLLSDSVMRLVNEKEKEKVIHVLLNRRSLYIMKDSARYDYTHEILPNNLSVFKQIPVKKTRRISVICRNEPEREDL
ncbi:alpha-ketoglutarate-dependent dioxygenase alkB homolog 7, mitochondrial [Lycorma delicatula]|uniref:alpha-ketoglutarate-dependent dioxygenase alkB homolog 7, mitochondrial n=1 Tax=Lycorma delicatula TaxID=130591 RepID=UPI003F516BCC